MERILIVIGSESDRKIAEKAEETLREFGVEYKLEVASAHRNPAKVEKIVSETNTDVIIAIAGKCCPARCLCLTYYKASYRSTSKCEA